MANALGGLRPEREDFVPVDLLGRDLSLAADWFSAGGGISDVDRAQEKKRASGRLVALGWSTPCRSRLPTRSGLPVPGLATSAA
jgi:hypothetical protein